MRTIQGSPRAGWFANATNGDTLGYFPTRGAARQAIQAAVLADNETDQ